MSSYLKAGVLLMEAIDVKELAGLGRDYRVPQLLNERAVKHYRGNPIAQAIAYDDARTRRRWVLAMLANALLAAVFTVMLTVKAVEYMPAGEFVTRAVAAVGIISLFMVIASFAGLLHIAGKHKLPPKDAAEGFSVEMTLIRDWYGSWHSIWGWPINHFGLRKMGEVILAGLWAKVLREKREREKVSDEEAKAKRTAQISLQEATFDQAHVLLLKYEMAGPDAKYYHEKGAKELAKQDRQAGLIAEYHELNHVSFEESRTIEPESVES